MNTTTLTSKHIYSSQKQAVPTTPRGSALYMVDYFLNGRPVLRNHDNPQTGITNLSQG